MKFIHRILQQVNITGNIQSTSGIRPYSPKTHYENTFKTIILLFIFIFIWYILYICYNQSDVSSADNPTVAVPAPTDHLTLTARNRKVGLYPSIIDSLPLVPCSSVAENCPICLSQFEQNGTVKLIPKCSHVFHALCIDTWLSLHVSCPVCRSTQMFNGADVGEAFSDCNAAAQV